MPTRESKSESESKSKSCAWTLGAAIRGCQKLQPSGHGPIQTVQAVGPIQTGALIARTNRWCLAYGPGVGTRILLQGPHRTLGP